MILTLIFITFKILTFVIRQFAYSFVHTINKLCSYNKFQERDESKRIEFAICKYLKDFVSNFIINKKNEDILLHSKKHYKLIRKHWNFADFHLMSPTFISEIFLIVAQCKSRNYTRQILKFENYCPKNGRQKKGLRCLMDYDDPAIFVCINQLFDYFPLAAIISARRIPRCMIMFPRPSVGSNKPFAFPINDIGGFWKVIKRKVKFA
ncbi:hypothetical protein ACH3XW_10315 [Acanthocheilonema viteae]